MPETEQFFKDINRDIDQRCHLIRQQLVTTSLPMTSEFIAHSARNEVCRELEQLTQQAQTAPHPRYIGEVVCDGIEVDDVEV